MDASGSGSPPQGSMDARGPRSPPQGPTRSRYKAPMTDRLVARFSSANRPFVEAGVQHRRNKGLKAGSIHQWVHVLWKAEVQMEGKPFAEATPQDLADVITSVRQASLADSTVHLTAVMLRQAWKDLLDMDNLPRDYARALDVREPRRQSVDRVLTDEEFKRLLGAARDMPGWLHGLQHSTQALAILWVLWDTGFRAQEMLSLNVGDVELDGTQGAQITLQPDAPNLKTGARSVYVAESAGMLFVYLKLHPWRDDPKAALFPGFRIGKAGRMQYLALSRFLNKVVDESGIKEDSSWTRNVTAHTFRHTAATRRARLGWNEAQLRAYFGWQYGSEMASHYVHLAASDLRDQVRRDAGLEGSQSASADDQATVASLVRVLKRLLNDDNHARNKE